MPSDDLINETCPHCGSYGTLLNEGDLDSWVCSTCGQSVDIGLRDQFMVDFEHQVMDETPTDTTFPADWQKEAMAMTPEMWQSVLQDTPYFYHVTHLERIEQIKSEGIRPGQPMGGIDARPGFIYLFPREEDAVDGAEFFLGISANSWIIKIDASQLDPTAIEADEDYLASDPQGFQETFGGPTPEEYYGTDDFNRGDWSGFGAQEMAGEPGSNWSIENPLLAEPEVAWGSYEENRTVAYGKAIPPEAIMGYESLTEAQDRGADSWDFRSRGFGSGGHPPSQSKLAMPYHVSPRKHREKIEQEGLHTFEENHDGTPQEPDGVYYWDTPEQAQYFGDTEYAPKPYDVWHFDLDPQFEQSEVDDFFGDMSAEEASKWYGDPRMDLFYNEDGTPGAHYIPGGHIEPSRLKRMTTYEPMPFERLAKFILKGDWNDIVAKAKRLIMDNQVTILNNTPEHIMAHVIGDGSDNGGSPDEHTVEISREDPESNVITQSVCDCAWNQYRYDRTRSWKRYEGRPCSHILATYWKSKSTPIDGVQQGYQNPVGQKGPVAMPGQEKLPGVEPGVTKQDLGMGAGAFGPEGQEGEPAPQPLTKTPQLPEPQQNPFTAPKAPRTRTPGQQPGVPQREQLQLFNLSPPPATTPPAAGFSQPGMTPPDPMAGPQLPGTFSSWASSDIMVTDDHTQAKQATRAAQAEAQASAWAPARGLALDEKPQAPVKLAMPEEFGQFQFPTPNEVHSLGQDVLGEDYQGVRDANSFSSGVQSAVNNHLYGGMADPFELAAHMIDSIQAKQGLIDGNKRTATAAGLSFLMDNGYPNAYELGHEPHQGQMADYIVGLAEGTTDVGELADYMRTVLRGTYSSWRISSDEDDWVPIIGAGGNEVIRGKPIGGEDSGLYEYVPETRTNDLDEALTDMRTGGYFWNIVPTDDPNTWEIRHKDTGNEWDKGIASHFITTRDLQLRGYEIWYQDPWSPGSDMQPSYYLHDINSDKGAGRIWATQRVDDQEDWQQPEPGALNEPWAKEKLPDFWQKHWGEEKTSGITWPLFGYHSTDLGPETIQSEGLRQPYEDRPIYFSVRGDHEYGPHQYKVDISMLDRSLLAADESATGEDPDDTEAHESPEAIQASLEYGWFAYWGDIPPTAIVEYDG